MNFEVFVTLYASDLSTFADLFGKLLVIVFCKLHIYLIKVMRLTLSPNALSLIATGIAYKLGIEELAPLFSVYSPFRFQSFLCFMWVGNGSNVTSNRQSVRLPKE